MSNYNITIDVSVLTEEEFDRWSRQVSPAGEFLREDPRILFWSGLDCNDQDQWTVKADSEDEVREIVDSYANAVGVGVLEIQVETVQGESK